MEEEFQHNRSLVDRARSITVESAVVLRLVCRDFYDEDFSPFPVLSIRYLLTVDTVDTADR